ALSPKPAFASQVAKTCLAVEISLYVAGRSGGIHPAVRMLRPEPEFPFMTLRTLGGSAGRVIFRLNVAVGPRVRRPGTRGLRHFTQPESEPTERRKARLGVGRSLRLRLRRRPRPPKGVSETADNQRRDQQYNTHSPAA